MKEFLGCLGVIALVLIVDLVIDAIAALIISWLLTFTPWHLSYMTCFAGLFILSIVAGIFRPANTKSK